MVFGATGLLGVVLSSQLAQRGHSVLRFVRDASNPCSNEAEISSSFRRALGEHKPDSVINLIGATNVELCEQNKGNAALLNCFVPQVLSGLCQANSIHLVHISSDQVYDGVGPHSENRICPANVYGLTKLVGEFPILQLGGCVLRTNFFGRSGTPRRISFSDWLVEGGRRGEQLNVFNDVWFSPLGMKSLSEAISRVIEKRLIGLYNLGASNGISKAAFAQALFCRLGLDTNLLRPVSIASAAHLVNRPRDMRMDSSRFFGAMRFDVPTIEEEIENEASEYK
jgi:dTDP-4-dehydrorhamnose reductase